MPLGAKYATWLLAALLCAVQMIKPDNRKAFWREPVALPAVLLVGWLALSGLWSPAPVTWVASQTGLYALMLGLPLIASMLSTAVGAAALRHFCWASGVVGLLFVMEPLSLLPPSLLWHTTVDAEGNQRIANSLLLALGVAFSLWHGAQTKALKPRLGWIVLAAVTALGLALQDRRTGLVVLPLALLAWALALQTGWRRRLLTVLGILLCTALVWEASDNVRARFDEGLREIRQYQSADSVSTSWGQRLRMTQITGEMVAENPLHGHGMASWKLLWQQRTTPGTQLHGQTTPHDEYLLLAAQAGLPAVLLWLWLLGAGMRSAVRAGVAGMPALMLWVSFACAAFFNVVLRDAKFSLPLLMVAAFCMAVQRAGGLLDAAERN